MPRPASWRPAPAGTVSDGPRWLPRGTALAVAIAAVLVLAAAGLAAATWATGSGRPPPAGAPPVTAAPPGSPSPPGGQRPGSPSPSSSQGQEQQGRLTAGAGWVASVPLSARPAGGQPAVTLVIVSGVPTVSVRAAAMPGTLIRAATGGQYGARPVLGVERGAGGGAGTVVGLSLAPAQAAGGAPGAGAALSVTLSTAVTWQLDFGGGTSQTAVDMTGGRVAGLAFGMGSAGITVTLPRPRGTVTLRLEGGASQLAVSVPAGVPARVTAGDGAGQVTVGGTSYGGIGAGRVITQPGWAAASGRLDISATSGVSQVTVTAR